MAMDSCRELSMVNGKESSSLYLFVNPSLDKYPPRIIYEVVCLSFLFPFDLVCLEPFSWWRPNNTNRLVYNMII
jgi:hypothetical protein